MNSFSIHPRTSTYGRDGVKKNTSKPHKGKGKLAKKRAWLSLRRLAHSQTIKTNRSENGWKTPGSMNQHK